MMGSRRGWGLRARLTALLVATLLPLMGLGVYWTLFEVRQAREQVEREARQIAAQIADRAGDRVGVVQEMLAVLARLPAVQAQDRGEVERLFRALLAASPHLENIAASTADGLLVASAVPVAQGVRISVRDRPWFQAVVRSGKPGVSGFEVGRIVGKPVVILAAPVVDGQGRVLGVVGAVLRLAAVSQEVAPAQPRGQVLWAVVDGQGLILFHGAPGAAIGKPLGPLPGMLRAEAPVPGTPWRAIVGTPEAVVAAHVRDELVEIGLPALLILLTATGVGFWIAYGTWRPLQRLAAAVQALGAGELGRRVPVGGCHDVAELAQAFNEMADRRQEAEAALTVSVVRRDTLTQLSAAIAAGTDRAEITRQVVEATSRLLGAPYAAMWTVEPGQERIVPAAEYVDPELGPIPPQPPLPLARSFLGAVLLREGKAVAIQDVRGDPRWGNPTWPGLGRLGGYLGVPLATGEAPVGALVAMDRPGRAFTDEEGELLQSLGTQAALALEKSRLLEEAQEAAAQAHALVEVGKVITGTLRLDAVLEAIVEKALEATGASACAIYRITPVGNLESVRAKGFLDSPRPPIVRSRREGLIGLCLGVGASVWSRDLLEDPRLSFSPESREGVRAEGVRAALAVPIVSPELRYGVLFIARRHVHDHSPAEVAFAEVLAAQAAIAIENARLYAQEVARAGALERRARALAALNETARLISSETDFLPLLQNIAESSRRLAGAWYGALGVLGEGERLAHFVQSGLTEDEVRRIGNLPTGKGLLGAMLREGRPLRLRDLTEDPRSGGFPPNHPPMRSFMGVPITLEGRVRGSLYLAEKLDGEAFSEEDEQHLLVFAAQAAIAIEKARLLEETRRRAREAEALAEVGRALNATLELDRVLDVIIQEVERVTAAPFVGLMALDPERQELAYVKGRGLSEERIASVRLKLDEGIAGRAVQQGVPLQSSDLAGDPRYARPGLAVSEGFRSVLCVPLRAAGRPLGALVLFQKDEHEFTRPEVDLVTRFADQAAVALHNAELYAAELAARREAEEALARVKQLQGLLPICSYCKKIRDDQNYWQQVEHYVAEHSEAQFSHGICPECYQKIAKPEMERLNRNIKKGSEGAS